MIGIFFLFMHSRELITNKPVIGIMTFPNDPKITSSDISNMQFITKSYAKFLEFNDA
jgi:hypothetical protein